MTLVMYDSVTVSETRGLASSSHDAVAGYLDGRFKNEAEMAAAHPNAHHLGIDVRASDDGECLDIENFDATPDQFGPWAKRQIARGVHRPVGYSDRSEHPAVVASANAAGLRRDQVRYWVATLDGNRDHALLMLNEPDIDAVQWTSKSHGRNLDESVLQDDFWGAPPLLVVTAAFGGSVVLTGADAGRWAIHGEHGDGSFKGGQFSGRWAAGLLFDRPTGQWHIAGTHA